jgi:hypothetical protein
VTPVECKTVPKVCSCSQGAGACVAAFLGTDTASSSGFILDPKRLANVAVNSAPISTTCDE